MRLLIDINENMFNAIRVNQYTGTKSDIEKLIINGIELKEPHDNLKKHVNELFISDKITEQLKLIMRDVYEYSFYDLIDIIASLHNEYYKSLHDEYYNYMFHWVNKATGNICDDLLFSEYRKEIEQ